ncbi:MAG: hypothetical protein II532_04860 [Bacteroidales bacterium]|nr:hypothetical protein [Bacteroidales bacterium]
MKKVFLIVMLTAFAWCSVAAQEDSKAKKSDGKVKVTPYGFVRNYFVYDSRRTYTVLDGEYNMQPYDVNWNLSEAQAALEGVERVDLNAVPSASLLALTTRVGLNLDGPYIWGAKTTGKIEGDFAGFGTNNYVIRLRHAFVQLDWDSCGKLLVGQYWHPLSGDIMPEVLGMAAGAPFRAHSRTPQISYQVYRGKLGFAASLLSQLQYVSSGPAGASYSYAYNAIVPEAFVGLNYKSSRVYAQLGADVLTIRPRVQGSAVTSTNVNYNIPVSDKLTSVTPTFYFQYVEPKFAVKFRTIYAQNTSHVNQLNGYAVTDVLPDGSWEYQPMRASISYLNLRYGSTYRFNLFLGYMKNLGIENGELYNFGTATNHVYHIYTKGNFDNINSVYRVAPSISYNVKAFNFGVEYELTAATYGDLATNGSILDNDNLRQVVNHRVCVLMKYNF